MKSRIKQNRVSSFMFPVSFLCFPCLCVWILNYIAIKTVILIWLHIFKEMCFGFLAFSCVMAVDLSHVHPVSLRTISVYLHWSIFGLNLYICRFGQLIYMEIITKKCRISLSAFCKMILMMLVLHPVYVKYLVCWFAFIGPFSTSSV